MEEVTLAFQMYTELARLISQLRLTSHDDSETPGRLLIVSIKFNLNEGHKEFTLTCHPIDSAQFAVFKQMVQSIRLHLIELGGRRMPQVNLTFTILEGKAQVTFDYGPEPSVIGLDIDVALGRAQEEGV